MCCLGKNTRAVMRRARASHARVRSGASWNPRRLPVRVPRTRVERNDTAPERMREASDCVRCHGSTPGSARARPRSDTSRLAATAGQARRSRRWCARASRAWRRSRAGRSARRPRPSGLARGCSARPPAHPDSTDRTISGKRAEIVLRHNLSFFYTQLPGV